MKICIGGDLNGQVVEKDVYSFKAAEIDPEKSQSISFRVIFLEISESYGQIWCTSIRRFSCLIAPLLVRRLGI